MTEPLARKAAQGVRHILPHAKVIVPTANFLWERREIKSQDQGGSGDLFPILLPPDPIHLRNAVVLKKGEKFVLTFKRKVFVIDHSLT